jgi:phosphopantothenoylcysteine decarboxylase/phosphopantothenate--cysteine ligase
MNDRMWAHRQTLRNAEHLRELGYTVLDPDDGPLAAGEGNGPGRMPEPDVILSHVGRLLEPAGALRGRRVLVTAGPTREPLDPVRFLSNHSSGKMGAALAAAAWRRGAEVTLVAGPMPVAPPVGPRVVRVETTLEMGEAVAEALPHADALIMAAAPADFAPATPAERKLKKHQRPDAVALTATSDILLATRARRRAGAVIVGFALETDDALANGRSKLSAKGLDLVVVNDATEAGAGFGVDTNRVTLVGADGGEEQLPLMAKDEVADVILNRVETLLSGR